MPEETFWSLCKSLPHWQFELMLMFLFDFVIGILIWPRLKKASKHHQSDDQKIENLEKEIAILKKHLGLPDNYNGEYLFHSVDDCQAKGNHASYVDRDGFCNLCGWQ